MQRLYETLLLLPATHLYRLLNQQRGQTLAEYSLIITIIAVAVVVVSMLVFRNALAGAFNTASTCLDGAC